MDNSQHTQQSTIFAPPGRRWTAILLVCVLLLVTIVIARGITRGEFNYNGDEPQQAMTGLYFADFLSDLPLTHPIQYTYRYYAQYPALGLIHWPPFFHFVEGILFLLLGPSVVTARVGVLLFALLGCYFWFKIVVELENEWTAAVSTALLATLPSVVLLEKTVMLELPSLALCIAASYFWLRYLRSGTSRPLYAFAVFASLALLTKQQSIYLAVFCFLTLVAERRWKWLMSGPILRALGVCLLLMGPFYFLAFSVHGKTIAYHAVETRVHNLWPFLFYWSTLPHQLGLTLLLLSALGVATCWWWGKRQNVVFMLMWIVACYGTFTVMAAKEARYILYWLPPFVYFAVAPLRSGLSSRWARAVAAVAIVLLLGSQVRSAWLYERPYVSGYAPVARYVTQSGTSGIVLFDGELSGNFIFYMRAFDPERRFIILDKALYVTRIMKIFGSVELLHTREELEDLIRRYGIRYVVVTENPQINFEVQHTLRELLESPQFKLVERSPVDSNMPNWQHRSVLLYENTQVALPTAQLLRLRMLTLNHDIVIPLADFKRR